MVAKTKPDCYKCIHRKSLAGSSYSACSHPSLKGLHGSGLEVMGILGSVGRIQQAPITSKELAIVCNSYGVAKGWFAFPWNYDPVWLVECKGFESNAAALS